MKKALINDRNIVMNVIVTEDGYSHSKYSVIDAEGKTVQPLDHYYPNTDEFVTPKLRLETPETIPNDGTTKTIQIGTSLRSEQTATVTIDDLVENITVPADSDYNDEITTTASVGTIIEVSVEGDSDIRGDAAQIEVIEA